MPGPEQEHAPEAVKIDRQILREHLYLIEQATVGKITVVPGTKLAFHYPADQTTRTAILQGLLDGTQDPTQAAPQLKPDGVTYDAREIGSTSLTTIMGKIRDTTAKAAYYDYERFAQFVANMHGAGIDVPTTEAIYDRIAQSRVRKIFLDTYGPTGRQQLAEAIQTEAENAFQDFAQLPSGEKIFEALKQNWATSDLMTMTRAKLETIISQLDPAEREVFEALKDPYRQFVQAGTAESFARLTTAVKSSLEAPQEQEKQTQEEQSESEENKEENQEGEEQKQEMQDYTKDPEDKDKSGPPPTPENPATPPPYQDKKKIDKERPSPGVYYYITPTGTSTAPMLGHYAGNKKSHFNPATKNWEEQNQLTPYNQIIPGTERQTITPASLITRGLIPIEVPTNYALDASSLQSTAKLQLLRNQKGCFFLKSPGRCAFSIDFLKEPTPFHDLPTAEDTKQLYQGSLSDETEKFLKTLAGSNLEKASAVKKYIRSHHFYPAEGNLDVAQHLKYKLSKLPENAFFQTLDSSKYLECQLTHTFFVAMMRKLGVSARVVEGDNVDKVVNGKAQIDSNTGHMWAEIWDGAKWVRIDATPQPEHKKDQNQDQNQDKDKNQDQPQQGQQADDNGMEQEEEGEENKSQQGEDESGESGKPQPGKEKPQQSGKGQPGIEGKPKPNMKFQDQGKPGEASNQQMQSGQKEVQQAQNLLKKMQQAQQKLEQELQKAQSFQNLEDLKQQAEKADLFEDMKQEIRDKITTQEEAEKETLKDTLDQMAKDGFIDEQKAQDLLEQIENGQTQGLDQAKHQVEIEGRLFNEYQEIKERVRPKVDKWFNWVVKRLPKEPDVDLDEDSLMTGGKLNIRAAMKPTNLYLGRVMNPRVVRSSERPMFLAAIEVDLSRSVMQMSPEKKQATEELMVFYCELFDRIEQRYGYMHWALDAFNDLVIPIKGYNQRYSSSQRNLYPDGNQATVKVRLMKALRIEGGTNINAALRYSAAGLNEQVAKYPRYLSAFYFIGDGEDSWTKPEVIKRFVDNINPQHGFGPHQRQAIFLGTEKEKQQLAAIFGDEHTSVCSNFDLAIEMSMMKFDEDIRNYLRNKIQ